jgi:hypothetical protein
MFATLIQVHDLWGMIARTAQRDGFASDATDAKPWETNSRYLAVARVLHDWEANLPAEHTWSSWNLRGYQAEHVDLAYLSIITITRMNNIVLRRTYLENIVSHILTSEVNGKMAPPGFWETMSHELFCNVLSLYEALETYLNLRGPDDGFPTMLAFCAYTCGSIVSYLWRWPALCPQLCSSAESAFNGTLEALSTFADKWPMAGEWVSLLRETAQSDLHEQMQPTPGISSEEVILNPLAESTISPLSCQVVQSGPTLHHEHGSNALRLLSQAATYEQQFPLALHFDAELANYMQGYMNLNFVDWQI